jgi:competence protein ComEC
VVILSHAHEDHAGGLVAVLQNFRVGLVLDSGLPHPAPSYARIRELVAARGIPYRLARRGMWLDLGDGLRLAVLLPQEPLITGSGSDVNLNSVVVRATYHHVGVLFTGDMEALNESQLLDLGDDVRSAILKVAHHGSDTGTTEAFVAAVRPGVAVISVGAMNPFGHPHRRTLDVLEEWGAQVYRTDRDGAVLIQSDGRRITVRTVRH